MNIVFKKTAAKNTLTCTRDDGTSTWCELESFLVLHDLTHFVVETTLNINLGFYGLLQQGYDITDFEKKQRITPRSLPPESIRTEILVTLLLTELNDQRPLTNFNDTFAATSSTYQLTITPLDADQLMTLRTGRDNLIKRWKNLPDGSTLVLTYPAKQIKTP